MQATKKSAAPAHQRVSALDHGHIYGQTQGLVEAGGECRYVWDTDPARVAKFIEKHPGAQPVATLDELLDKKDVHLINAAAIIPIPSASPWRNRVYPVVDSMAWARVCP
jgi:hypothetical protein